MAGAQKLSITILVDSDLVPAWQWALIDKLQRSPLVKISLLIELVGATNPSQQRRYARLYSRLTTYDRPQIPPEKDANQLTSIRLMKLDCATIRIAPSHCSTGDSRHSLLRNALNNAAHDCVLVLSSKCLNDVLNISHDADVWYFRNANDRRTEGTGLRVGFWEVVKRQPSVQASMIIREGCGKEYVAYKSHSPVYASSFTRTNNELLWKLPFFVLRTIERISRTSADSYKSEVDLVCSQNIDEGIPTRKATSYSAFRSAISYLLYRTYKKVVTRFVDERWVLQFCRPAQFDQIQQSTVIAPPRDRFWADPHCVAHGKGLYVFFEDASIETGRGRISVLSISDDGVPSDAKPVLERSYHLSYPFLFEFKEDLYMIPESAENRSIELYRCTRFPDRWEFVHNLMEDISAYDATLVEHDNFWWMFVNIQQDPRLSSWDELFIFYTDDPIGQQWHPHSANPVLSDVRRARPAGRIFQRGDALYRPSQNSSFRYGYGIQLNRIIELTPECFAEVPVESVEPTWSKSVRAIHTLAVSDQFLVTDVIIRTVKFPRRSQAVH